MEEEIDNIPFDKNEWIAKGRLYPKTPKDIPLGLAYYCDAQRKLPDSIIDEWIPGPLVAVKALVNSQRPKIRRDLTSIKAQGCFSKLPPHDIGNLEVTDIPSATWVAKLDNHCNQAILDDNHSLINPEYPGVRLPLWMIDFWKKMHYVNEIQQGWKESLLWLEESIGSSQSEQVTKKLKEAEALVHMLRWNEETNIPGADNTATTFTFSAYLSDNRMMSNTHINIMFSYLADRAEEDEHIDNHVAIENLRFMSAINKVFKNEGSMKFLRRLEEKVKSDKLLAIEFPVYMEKEKHWIAMMIDFESEEISFGDSLGHKGMAPPKAAIKAIQYWTKKRFNKEYKTIGNSLEHGNQDDWTECGILTANTVAHDVFGDPIWTPAQKALSRLTWFIQLSKVHIDYINKSEKHTAYPHLPGVGQC